MDDSSEVVFDTYFYSDNKSVNQLHTIVAKRDGKYFIKDEYLKSKPISKAKKKDDVFDFDNCETAITGDNDEDFLPEDVSIIIALNKCSNKRMFVENMLQYTNSNRLKISEDCSSELIAFFDPSVEYLHIKQEKRIRIFG